VGVGGGWGVRGGGGGTVESRKDDKSAPSRGTLARPPPPHTHTHIPAPFTCSPMRTSSNVVPCVDLYAQVCVEGGHDRGAPRARCRVQRGPAILQGGGGRGVGGA